MQTLSDFSRLQGPPQQINPFPNPFLSANYLPAGYPTVGYAPVVFAPVVYASPMGYAPPGVYVPPTGYAPPMNHTGSQASPLVSTPSPISAPLTLKTEERENFRRVDAQIKAMEERLKQAEARAETAEAKLKVQDPQEHRDRVNFEQVEHRSPRGSYIHTRISFFNQRTAPCSPDSNGLSRHGTDSLKTHHLSSPPDKAMVALQVTPVDGARVFYLPSGASQTKSIFTPNGRHVCPRGDYEGRSHLLVEACEGIFIRVDKPLPENTPMEYHRLYVLAKFKELRNRVNTDANIKRDKGAVEAGHYKATRLEIVQVIDALIQYIIKSGDVVRVNDEVNQYISSGHYNPFALLQQYSLKNIPKEVATNLAIDLKDPTLTLQLLTELTHVAEADYYSIKDLKKNVASNSFLVTQTLFSIIANMFLMRKDSPDFYAFLRKINNEISSGRIYNPLSLYHIYEGEFYNKVLAKNEAKLREPITVQDIHALLGKFFPISVTLPVSVFPALGA